MALESLGGVFVLIFPLSVRRRPRRIIFWGFVLKIPLRQFGSARLFGPYYYPPHNFFLKKTPFSLPPIFIFALVFSLLLCVLSNSKRYLIYLR